MCIIRYPAHWAQPRAPVRPRSLYRAYSCLLVNMYTRVLATMLRTSDAYRQHPSCPYELSDVVNQQVDVITGSIARSENASISVTRVGKGTILKLFALQRLHVAPTGRMWRHGVEESTEAFTPNFASSVQGLARTGKLLYIKRYSAS